MYVLIQNQMYISQHKYYLLGNNRKYFLNEKDTNFDDVKLFIQILKVLITSQFNDKILDDHFLVPVEHKTS